jgi:hypothetical protein
MTKNDRTAIIVALIGTVGVLGAAAIGSWDRIRPRVNDTEVTGNADAVKPPPQTEPDPAPPVSVHCTKPTTPVLEFPGANQVQSNHYYGQGKPLRFSWLPSSCSGGSIRGYRIVVTATGATVPAIDRIVTEPRYEGNTSGTISARQWIWRVQAIDDLNQMSDWSEERPFYVAEWRDQ